MENKQTAFQHLVHTIENQYIGNDWDKLKEAILAEEKQQMMEMFLAGFSKSTISFNAANDDLSKDQIEEVLKEFFEQTYKKMFNHE